MRMNLHIISGRFHAIDVGHVQEHHPSVGFYDDAVRSRLFHVVLGLLLRRCPLRRNSARDSKDMRKRFVEGVHRDNQEPVFDLSRDLDQVALIVFGDEDFLNAVALRGQ